MSVLDQFKLDGKAAAVAGGARGIGRRLSLALADAGANIAILDVLRDEADQTLSLLKQLGRNAVFIECDVTQRDQVQSAAGQALASLGRCDVLVNCAGIVIHGDSRSVPEDEWDRVLDVNLKGTFLCCQAFAPQMIHNGWGRIINIASMSAHVVNRPQTQASYNASKAGVIQLTRSLAVEWAKYGVNVNSISPGYINTEMTQMVNEYHDGWKADTPMGRLGKPEELQALCVYLASDASSYMTGSDVVIDGGFTCW